MLHSKPSAHSVFLTRYSSIDRKSLSGKTRVSTNCTCLRTAAQYCCLTTTSSSMIFLPRTCRDLVLHLYATRSSRTSIVANVTGQSDTHHGGRGGSAPDVHYFYCFQHGNLVGQVGNGPIDGLAQFLAQHVAQRLRQHPAGHVEHDVAGIDLDVSHLDHGLAVHSGKIEV